MAESQPGKSRGSRAKRRGEAPSQAPMPSVEGAGNGAGGADVSAEMPSATMQGQEAAADQGGMPGGMTSEPGEGSGAAMYPGDSGGSMPGGTSGTGGGGSGGGDARQRVLVEMRV